MDAHRPPIYGLMAEFENPDDLLAAAQRAHEAGYRKMDAYTPFPVHDLAETLGRHRTRLPALVFAAGLTGAAGGYLLQLYTMAVDYPLNVGGRPYNSWPAFIPVTFELTILLAAFAAVIGMLALNGLPRPYHPVFNVPGFDRATRDRFFLCIEAADPRFDRTNTQRFLESLEPLRVAAVEH